MNPLLDEIVLAISEHHSGNGEEAYKIAQAAIDVVKQRLLSDAVLEAVRESLIEHEDVDFDLAAFCAIDAASEAVKGGDV
jgi:hypothetical protein